MEFLHLIKVDLRIKYNTIFDSKNKLVKVSIFFFIALLLILPLEFLIIRNYKILSAYDMENIIFNSILNTELLLIFIVNIVGISNNFFLEHGILNLWFYPLTSKSIFFSKSILEYLKSLLIALIGLILLITYGILNNWTVYYYFKAICLTLILPIICIIIIINFFLFISVLFTNIKKYYVKKIFFCTIQLLNIYFVISYIINNDIDFIKINNFISSLFYNKISFEFSTLILLITNIIIFIFYTNDIYLNMITSDFKLIQLKNKRRIKENKKFDFKSYNILLSSIKRDLKEILRTPILIINAITPNIMFFIVIILLTPLVSNSIKSVDFFLVFIVVILSVTTTSFNTVANFAFSRETNNLKYLEYLPLSIIQLFTSKIILALLFNMLNLISINILIISINKNIINIILLNIIATLTMISITLINITTDFYSIKKAIVNLSEIFNDVELVLKPLIKTIPLTLLYIAIFVFISRMDLFYNLKGLIIITTYISINIVIIIVYFNKIKHFQRINH